MRRYDPGRPIPAAQWLAIDEATRLSLVRSFHARSGGFGENLEMHAVMHVVVENQVAASDPVEVCQALERLQAAGLSRHDALHAVATVLAEQSFPLLSARGSQACFDTAAYARALAELTVASWMGMGRR